jgi:predicted ATPase
LEELRLGALEVRFDADLQLGRHAEPLAELKLSAEHRFVVEPLAVPDSPESATLAEVEHASATAMFIAAAGRHDHRFSVAPETAAAVARLCSKLDGLPLAIELAAAHTGLFGIEELAAQLSRELGVLGGGPRDLPARQQTLRATIEWSCRLLDGPQRNAFARISAFEGGSTFEAATEVTGATPSTIGRLIDKSLLACRTAADGAKRLTILETVREYALERLAEHPVDLGLELRQRVQPRLAPAPVAIARPVARELLDRRQLHALRAIIDELLARQAGRREASTEVLQSLVRNVYVERADRRSTHPTTQAVCYARSVRPRRASAAAMTCRCFKCPDLDQI